MSKLKVWKPQLIIIIPQLACFDINNSINAVSKAKETLKRHRVHSCAQIAPTQLTQLQVLVCSRLQQSHLFGDGANFLLFEGKPAQDTDFFLKELFFFYVEQGNTCIKNDHH